MKEIQEILAEATHFKERRANLALGIRQADERYRSDLSSLEAKHQSKVAALEEERKTAFSTNESHARKLIADYVRMKNNLHQQREPIKQWCVSSDVAGYIPNPARVNETELDQLMKMLQEQGFLAWIKRTFKLNGYTSRTEMALDYYKKIEDACAYCDTKIAEIEQQNEGAYSRQVTETRRKIENEQEQYKRDRASLEKKYLTEKEQANSAIAHFDNSAELQNMHERINKMHLDAENACGTWGEYAVPRTMPEKVLLCDAKVLLPNTNGIDEIKSLPVWLDLYESNIIVVTSNSGAASGTDCKEKQFVRKLLSRLLKTVPPEDCSFSVFDSLHKGASLERLIDITNIGATDIQFNLFTSNENDGTSVSCAERRTYLRNRPAEIIKFIAGKNKSLFEYNEQTNGFEFPFSWYIDFNFPENPDTRLMDDIKELLVNASTAGYSFVFVTTPNGLKKINELASLYTSTQVIHVDVDRAICKKGPFQVNYIEKTAPNSEQIYNFVTALKKFYDEGNTVDNRIASVYSTKGIQLRDASAKLTVPMALDSRGRLVDMELGGDGSVHGFISGSSNSGKSTLLHTIILGACLHYHPSDLEIWLVDYKQTEFHLYKKKTPPHIKLIGVSKTADFTFSLLDRIEAEANRRTDLMNLFDVQNLEDYRKHKGEPGYEHLTRIFVVIDEFHEMSQFVAAETVYKDKLENCLREYRAQGFTFLLADQTFSSGLSGLTTPAKNQIGLRIAMRNEGALDEIKGTLEVNSALYSDNLQHTISIMGQGDFITKVYIRDAKGKLKDVKLEKFKALLTKGEDIAPVGTALRMMYKGQYANNLLYVNTKEQVPWDNDEPKALDQAEHLRYPNIRLYLGRSATLRPCFGIDIGRQPNENLSIVGGTAFQRWELLSSVIRSCKFKNYKLLVFAAEYSDLMNDYGKHLRTLCAEDSNAELFETTAEWCYKLSALERVIDDRSGTEDIVCVFVGLEIANIEMSRLPTKTKKTVSSFDLGSRYGTPIGEPAPTSSFEQSDAEFNALPIIDKLFSSGARNGIRCVSEVSVYRQFAKLLKLKEMCRHKIAFSMSADDCMMYLGSSSFQKSIGRDAIYCDGGKEVKKLIPYKLENAE